MLGQKECITNTAAAGTTHRGNFNPDMRYWAHRASRREMTRDPLKSLHRPARAAVLGDPPVGGAATVYGTSRLAQQRPLDRGNHGHSGTRRDPAFLEGRVSAPPFQRQATTEPATQPSSPCLGLGTLGANSSRRGVLLKGPGVLLKDPGILLKDPAVLLKDSGVLLKDPLDGCPPQIPADPGWALAFPGPRTLRSAGGCAQPGWSLGKREERGIA